MSRATSTTTFSCRPAFLYIQLNKFFFDSHIFYIDEEILYDIYREIRLTNVVAFCPKS